MNDIYFYIDESFDKTNNILSLCLIVISSNEYTDIKNSITNLKDDICNDQYLGIRKKNIKNLFHFTDDNYEVRNKLIDHLRYLQFTGYIAYKKVSDSYQETYKYLLYKLTKDRIKKNSDKYIKITYEQNPNIADQALNDQIENIKKELQKKYPDNSIYNIEIHKGTKDNIMLSIPDYTLGIFSNYLENTDKNNSHLSFEKIRGKIRLIMDLDNHKYFNRNNVI